MGTRDIPLDAVDQQGGPCYSKYERVRVESVWRETLGKEMDSLAHARRTHGTNGFQMNLASNAGSSGIDSIVHSHNRIEIVTEKEHKQTPTARMSIKGMDPLSVEVLAIKHTAKKPFEKWDLPATTAHDLGWLQQGPMRSDTLRKSQHHWATRTSAGLTDGFRSLPASLSRSVSSPSSLQKPMAATDGFSFTRSLAVPTGQKALRRQMGEQTQSAPAINFGPPHPDLRRLNNRRWNRPRISNDVTKYSETYVKLLHHDPFNQAAAGR